MPGDFIFEQKSCSYWKKPGTWFSTKTEYCTVKCMEYDASFKSGYCNQHGNDKCCCSEKDPRVLAQRG